jgi:hypothetical protein
MTVLPNADSKESDYFYICDRAQFDRHFSTGEAVFLAKSIRKRYALGVFRAN